MGLSRILTVQAICVPSCIKYKDVLGKKGNRTLCFGKESMSAAILRLQPRDKAAMLGVNTMECFL